MESIVFAAAIMTNKYIPLYTLTEWQIQYLHL